MTEKHSATNTYTLEFKSEPDVLLDRLEELARDHRCARSYALEDIAGMLALAAMSLGIGALMLFATRARVELEGCAAWLRGYYVGQKVDYNLVWEFSPGVRIHRVLDHLRLAELQVDGEGATPREGDREFARGVKAARFAARAIAENAGF